ncbi:hypothetical protein PAXRUDRAFT_20649 [Paxillus rubicundulus Ve08.2h10]|uniref:Uncharacterized protein n=1 Tax=Paxillus rubicundulus Ve08.2h10 TaxID=930991 RepID=A0A0D0D1A7_9AGAM|nr:hypothetical protein PAXRUDRAFT_20649 [Paxillus rubicundulus Ve08.2h10]
MSMERATSMPCPPDSPWALTDLIMEYMHRRFHAELFPMTDPKGILPDINIPTEMESRYVPLYGRPNDGARQPPPKLCYQILTLALRRTVPLHFSAMWHRTERILVIQP